MKKVFVNGTFDILHRGHIELLNYARSCGSSLHVGIDSDKRVSLMKGLERPIYTQNHRKYILENLKAVDSVEIFSSDRELCQLIIKYKPDIMVVGSDWRRKPVIGEQYAGELRFFERIDGYATTKTVQSIIDRR